MRRGGGGGAECETNVHSGSEGTREELALAVLNAEPEGGGGLAHPAIAKKDCLQIE